MKQEHVNEIKAISFLAIGIILLASLISFVPEDLSWYTSQPNVPAKNLVRITGAYLSGGLLFVFGNSAYFLVGFLLMFSWNTLFADRKVSISAAKIVCFIILFSSLSALLSLIGSEDTALRFQRGGIIGSSLGGFLYTYCGPGAFVILGGFIALTFIITAETLLSPIIMRVVEYFTRVAAIFKDKWKGKAISFDRLKPKINFGGITQTKSSKKRKELEDEEEVEDEEFEEDDEEYDEDEDGEEDEEEFDRKSKSQKPKIKIAPQSKTEKSHLGDEPIVVGEYHLPLVEVLSDPPTISASKIENDLISGAKFLEQTLLNFGVNARVADIERGPAITRYELEPAPGVKVQKFTTLSDDIALAMKAQSIRIVAPIPGKNRVGVEVPNGTSAAVFLKEVLISNEFRSSKSKLTLSLGKDVSGAPMIADLAEMPHLLIAGTTGSGKTVCVNGIIMSMLFNASPDEVRFVMVDPKMVELAQYNDIPHLLCPTVTDSKKASAVLHWVVGEMENRYKRLSKEGVRNIKAYNDRGKNMPYIVVIIDELADLMQVSAKAVESSITRLAQLSRAVGIHLILATQRPSVDVITGVIKANFPARISFKVASKVDSRTVLDMNGAENLLGKGDMLFFQPGDSKPTRGQCSFVSDEEIHRTISFIKDQQEPSYDESILTQQKTAAMGGVQQKDEFYDEAVKLVIETNQASVSILQRRMRLGYTRAARLIDMMEQHGIVGPYCGSKPREIMIDREQWLLENMGDEEDNE